MANYTGTLVEAPSSIEAAWNASVSSTIQAAEKGPPAFPPTEIATFDPIAESDYAFVEQSENETVWTGTKVDSFLDDYYYRTYMITTPIAFGSIVATVEEEFTLWNAWFDIISCSAIVKTNATEYTLDPEVTPFSIAPLGSKVFTVEVSEIGATEFSATITFTLTSETLVLTMTGTRVAVFPFEPSLPLLEGLECLTDIITSKDGSEQRMTIRPTPRQRFQFNSLLKTEQEQARLDALLFQWMKRTWGVPIWGEVEEHTADIDVDDTVINLDTTNADFRDDSYAIIWQSFDSYESIKIATVADASLTLETPVLNSWTGLKWIMPLRIGYMIGPAPWDIDTDTFGHFKGVFIIKDNKLITTYSAPTEYEGLPVLPATLVEDGLENSVDSESHFIEYGIDSFTMFSDSDFNKYTQRHIFRSDTKAKVWAFREFLHYLYGRRNPVWIVSDKNDFQQTQTLGAAETEVTVANVGWARNMTLNTLRTHIAFTLSDGTQYFREITGITTSGDEEIIGFSSALGVELEVGDCVISMLDKCRLTEDNVEMEWVEPGTLICRTNFTRVIA